MKHTKESLRAAVIRVFETECNLDNYEFVALVDSFEEYLMDAELPSATFEAVHPAVRDHLIGALEFLTRAQHITEEQCAALCGLLDEADNSMLKG